ncbi:unnamed protein product [Protopolystoma xenopodis]|uniref:Uncharacterized protein n=1 Tax=Protopolystoma xenopodis TaxID=117903 RepID=A0A3S4ZTY5_9PLAT|nr:unnamed protein product [Protopolystoma xenopodis]
MSHNSSNSTIIHPLRRLVSRSFKSDDASKIATSTNFSVNVTSESIPIPSLITDPSPSSTPRYPLDNHTFSFATQFTSSQVSAESTNNLIVHGSQSASPNNPMPLPLNQSSIPEVLLDNECNREVAMLYLLLLIGTVWIAIHLLNFTKT